MGEPAPAGTPVREVPLLWAQQPMWRHYRTSRRSNTVGSAVRVPADCTRQDVQEAIRRTVAAYEVLRTSYRAVPGGEVCQLVAERAAYELEVRDVTGYLRPDTQAARFFDELQARSFELEERPPFRFGLVESSATPRWLLFAAHHIAVDGLGVEALAAALARSLADVRAGRPPGTEPVRQPRDEVRYEATDGAVAATRDALRHWAGLIETFPPTPMPVRAAGTAERRPMEAALASAGLTAAMRELARRYRVVEPVVMLSVFTCALLRLSGNRRTAVRIFCSNRYRAELDGYVGCLTQNLPVVIGAAPDRSLSAVVRSVAATVGSAYRLGRYDFEAAETLRARRQFERGVNMQTMPGFNYVTHRQEMPVRTSRRRPRADGGDPVSFSPNVRDPWPALGLNVVRSAREVSMTVPFNAATVSEAVAGSFLTGLRDMLVAAAHDPDASVSDLLDRAGLPGPVPDGGRWITRDGTRICLDDIESLVRGHPAVDDCRVTAGEGGDSVAITAHVASGEARPAQLRTHCFGQLGRWPAAVVPDLFVVVPSAGPPDSPWWERPPRATGTGHEGPWFDPRAPMAQVLDQALALTSPDARWEGAASYLAAGGRLGRIDGFLAAVAALGATGLTYGDLSGPCPPDDLLTRVRPAAP